jgi:hypothetical protein
MKFNRVIFLLKSRINEIDSLIRECNGIDIDDFLEEKKAIKFITNLIKKIDKEGIDIPKNFDLIKIPETGYCDVRIVIDPESDDKNFWFPLKINEEEIFLKNGDIILKTN